MYRTAKLSDGERRTFRRQVSPYTTISEKRLFHILVRRDIRGVLSIHTHTATLHKRDRSPSAFQQVCVAPA